jgi:hypothetical protein
MARGIEPYDAYVLFQSVRLHFASETYDAIKYNFKTSASPQAFFKRRDKHFYAKLAQRHQDKGSLLEFLVANYLYRNSPCWVGDMIEDGDEYLLKWKGARQRLQYMFKNDIETLAESGVSLENVLRSNNGSNPPIIGYMISQTIDPMSVVVMDKLTGFLKKENKNVQDRIAWPTIYLRLVKTSPFVQLSSTKPYKAAVLGCEWSDT